MRCPLVGGSFNKRPYPRCRSGFAPSVARPIAQVLAWGTATAVPRKEPPGPRSSLCARPCRVPDALVPLGPTHPGQRHGSWRPGPRIPWRGAVHPATGFTPRTAARNTTGPTSSGWLWPGAARGMGRHVHLLKPHHACSRTANGVRRRCRRLRSRTGRAHRPAYLDSQSGRSFSVDSLQGQWWTRPWTLPSVWKAIAGVHIHRPHVPAGRRPQPAHVRRMPIGDLVHLLTSHRAPAGTRPPPTRGTAWRRLDCVALPHLQHAEPTRPLAQLGGAGVAHPKKASRDEYHFWA